jgi:ATP-dependent DNA helicase RecG
LQAISQHGSMNRKDIDNLLWNKLPEIINDKQKINMIKNLISELRILNRIINSGTKKDPVWILEIEK